MTCNVLLKVTIMFPPPPDYVSVPKPTTHHCPHDADLTSDKYPVRNSPNSSKNIVHRDSMAG